MTKLDETTLLPLAAAFDKMMAPMREFHAAIIQPSLAVTAILDEMKARLTKMFAPLNFLPENLDRLPASAGAEKFSITVPIASLNPSTPAPMIIALPVLVIVKEDEKKQP
ncbi:MAG TPA: hypothetical protein VKT70_04070 [Stellaceae bacterium]|nr:hypothetical protein [Stellaceae bacterium]